MTLCCLGPGVSMGVYNIFICHVYSERNTYLALLGKLYSVPRFDWQNQSVQYHMRHRDMSENDLQQAIREKIRASDVVLAFTSVAMSHKEWVHRELSIALSLDKPIIAITKDKRESKSKFVREAAKIHVDSWQT